MKSSLYLLNALSGVTSKWCQSLWLCVRPKHQVYSGGKLLAACGRFDMLSIWSPNCPHQKQTSYH